MGKGRSTTRQQGGAAVALLALAAAVACSDAGPGDGDDAAVAGDRSDRSGRGGATGGAPAGADALTSVSGALAILPDNGEDTLVINWGDIERVADLAGLVRPTDPTDEAAVEAYLDGIRASRPTGDDGAVPALTLPETTGAPLAPADVLPAFVDDVGWSVLQVDRFIELQPFGSVAVLEGGFDQAAITGALGEPTDGVWIAGRGDPDDNDPSDRTPARVLGQSQWLYGGDRHLAISRSPELTDAAAAALTGEGSAVLADDPVLAALGAALDEQSAYTANLSRTDGDGDDPYVVESPERPGGADDCGQLLRQPALGVATGLTHDDGPVILVARAHASSDAASETASAIEDMVAGGDSLSREQPWSDLVELDGVDTTGDGTVTIARLRPREPGDTSLWWQILWERENLLASC